jgi:hypothetical protein
MIDSTKLRAKMGLMSHGSYDRRAGAGSSADWQTAACQWWYWIKPKRVVPQLAQVDREADAEDVAHVQSDGASDRLAAYCNAVREVPAASASRNSVAALSLRGGNGSARTSG